MLQETIISFTLGLGKDDAKYLKRNNQRDFLLSADCEEVKFRALMRVLTNPENELQQLVVFGANVDNSVEATIELVTPKEKIDALHDYLKEYRPEGTVTFKEFVKQLHDLDVLSIILLYETVDLHTETSLQQLFLPKDAKFEASLETMLMLGVPFDEGTVLQVYDKGENCYTKELNIYQVSVREEHLHDNTTQLRILVGVSDKSVGKHTVIQFHVDCGVVETTNMRRVREELISLLEKEHVTTFTHYLKLLSKYGQLTNVTLGK